MDLFRALGISASGMAAQRARMDAISDNLANSETSVTAGGGPYRRKVVVLQAADERSFPAVLRRAGDPADGVRVADVRETSDVPRRVYQPGHPQADREGFVALPNVNPITEMVDMLLTTRAYEANAAAFQAAKSMGAKLLELLR
jgi:flagellar basal-body rod protein FlgC